MSMTLVEAPALRPFIALDGSQDAPLIDTLVTHPHFGRVYLPWRMVRDAARLLGYATGEEHGETLEELEQARERISELEGELADLVPVRDAIEAASRRFGDVAADDEPIPRAPARKQGTKPKAATS